MTDGFKATLNALPEQLVKSVVCVCVCVCVCACVRACVRARVPVSECVCVAGLNQVLTTVNKKNGQTVISPEKLFPLQLEYFADTKSALGAKRKIRGTG